MGKPRFSVNPYRGRFLETKQENGVIRVIYYTITRFILYRAIDCSKKNYMNYMSSAIQLKKRDPIGINRKSSNRVIRVIFLCSDLRRGSKSVSS